MGNVYYSFLKALDTDRMLAPAAPPRIVTIIPECSERRVSNAVARMAAAHMNAFPMDTGWIFFIDHSCPDELDQAGS
jgi:hypothetical protein